MLGKKASPRPAAHHQQWPTNYITQTCSLSDDLIHLSCALSIYSGP